jgi:hypothetical protein
MNPTASELAKSLGISPELAVQVLNGELKEWVKGPASRLEAPAIRKLTAWVVSHPEESLRTTTSGSLESAGRFVSVRVRGALHASRLTELITQQGLIPPSYFIALAVSSGEAVLELPDVESAEVLAAAFERYGARVSRTVMTPRVSAALRIPLAWRAPRDSGPGATISRAVASVAEDSAFQQLRGELVTAMRHVLLRGGLAARSRQVELLSWLLEASGVADDTTAALAELEASDPQGIEDVRAWIDGDGGRWVRKPSGRAGLWLNQ